LNNFQNNIYRTAEQKPKVAAVVVVASKCQIHLQMSTHWQLIHIHHGDSILLKYRYRSFSHWSSLRNDWKSIHHNKSAIHTFTESV